MRSDHHHREGYVEVRRVGYESLRYAVGKRTELVYAYYSCGDEADYEHDGAEEAEHVHRLAPETAKEPQRDEVKVAVEEAVEPELRLAVFTRLMVYYLFAYLVEAGVLARYGM